MHDRQLRVPADAGSGPITINTAAIPAHVREDLAAATLELIRGILRQPGGRERLDAKKAELAAKQNQTERSVRL
jgi:hypothetical protein